MHAIATFRGFTSGCGFFAMRRLVAAALCAGAPCMAGAQTAPSFTIENPSKDVGETPVPSRPPATSGAMDWTGNLIARFGPGYHLVQGQDSYTDPRFDVRLHLVQTSEYVDFNTLIRLKRNDSDGVVSGDPATLFGPSVLYVGSAFLERFGKSRPHGLALPLSVVPGQQHPGSPAWVRRLDEAQVRPLRNETHWLEDC
jgi:hypothetical protein